MRKLITAALLLQLCAIVALARRLPNWPYEKLFSESDIVVIAEPTSTISTTDSFDHEGDKREDYTGMNTEFQVRWSLKGELRTGTFTVLHFRYSDTVQAVANGALFVRFRLKERSFSGQFIRKNKDGSWQAPEMTSMAWGRPDYLLFLKRRKDGRYEPVSGQYDAALSCREVSNVEPVSLGPENND